MCLYSYIIYFVGKQLIKYVEYVICMKKKKFLK